MVGEKGNETGTQPVPITLTIRVIDHSLGYSGEDVSELSYMLNVRLECFCFLFFQSHMGTRVFGCAARQRGGSCLVGVGGVE